MHLACIWLSVTLAYTAYSQPVRRPAVAPAAPREADPHVSDCPHMSRTDAQLVEASLAGGRIAQRALYERHAGKLYGLALRYLRHPETAQDVLAEAWIKIFGKLNSYNREGSFEGWLKRIVVNESLMYLRKRRVQYAELSDAITETTATPVRVTDQLEHADVLRLLDTLSDGCRTVFNLYELEGYKHREIAEQLGISINPSNSQLILAKKRLREAYLALATREGRDLRNVPDR